MKQVFIRGSEGEFENYMAAMRACGVEPVRSLDLSLAVSCDGLLIPGGADVNPSRYGQENIASMGIDEARDEAELALIRQFLELERPIFGICRGFQMLNVALGGTLRQHITADNHTQVDGKDRFHSVRVVHSFLRTLYGEQFVSNSSHHQALDRLGEGLSLTCVSEDGIPEGVIHENGRVFGVQFHPERMSFALRRPECDDGAPILQAFCAML